MQKVGLIKVPVRVIGKSARVIIIIIDPLRTLLTSYLILKIRTLAKILILMV